MNKRKQRMAGRTDERTDLTPERAKRANECKNKTENNKKQRT